MEYLVTYKMIGLVSLKKCSLCLFIMKDYKLSRISTQCILSNVFSMPSNFTRSLIFYQIMYFYLKNRLVYTVNLTDR